VAEPLRLAHRGDWRVAPENSLAAMEAALRVPGCDGLEFDVRASSDGVPILLHDPSLLRVQGVDAVPSALTAAECAEHGISNLAEVLGAIGCDPFLDVELKERVPGAIDVLGMVKVKVNGAEEIVDIKIEKDVINPDDKGMLEDLVLAAANEGIKKAKKLREAELAKITGMVMPGLM